MSKHEQAKWKVATTITKYANEQDYENKIVLDKLFVKNNTLTKQGAKAIFELMSNKSQDFFDAQRTSIIISSETIDMSSTASPKPRDLDSLSGTKQPILSSYPIVEENYSYEETQSDGSSIAKIFDVALLFSSTFYGSQANGNWNSFGISRLNSNGTSTLLNARNVDGVFNKEAGQVVNIVIAIGIE